MDCRKAQVAKKMGCRLTANGLTYNPLLPGLY